MWLVVNTHPHREDTVVDHLSRQGFAPYCPRIEKRVRHARRVAVVRRALFPGYLFVREPNADRPWRPIMSTVGVRGLVGVPEPARLDDGFIDALMARERDGVLDCDPMFHVGQGVVIRGGAMDGFVAEVCEMREHDRIVVLLDLLSRKVRLNVRSDDLEPVS